MGEPMGSGPTGMSKTGLDDMISYIRHVIRSIIQDLEDCGERRNRILSHSICDVASNRINIEVEQRVQGGRVEKMKRPQF